MRIEAHLSAGATPDTGDANMKTRVTPLTALTGDREKLLAAEGAAKSLALWTKIRVLIASVLLPAPEVRSQVDLLS